MSENEKALLRVEFLKTWVTTVLAVLAGEITILNAFYKSSDYLWILYISMGAFIFAVIFCLGAYEAVVNYATGAPQVNHRFLNRVADMSPKTEVHYWILSAIGSVFIAVGIISAGIFLFVATT